MVVEPSRDKRFDRLVRFVGEDGHVKGGGQNNAGDDRVVALPEFVKT